MDKKRKRAFTLIELIVVIAILALLAAIAIPRYQASREKAAITAHNANVKTLMSAASTYLAENGNTQTTWTGGENESWNKYLQTWPKVPKGVGNSSSYSVEIGSDGSIKVTPAMKE